MNIVISYAREDRGLVEELVGTLTDFGHRPWTDAGAHTGGQWWTEIIQRIQACDALLLVMSPAYLASKACMLERQYAMKLGRPILPIQVVQFPVQRLPVEIAQVQMLDYTLRDAAAGARLFQALAQLPPAPPLPYPPPPPPPPPLSYLNRIADQMDRLPADLHAQHEIVTALTQGLRSADPEERDTAANLLQAFLNHPNRMQDPAERAAAALGRGGANAPPPPLGPMPVPTPSPSKRSPVLTVLAVIGAASLLVIVLVVALSANAGDGPTPPDPPIAEYLPGDQIARDLAANIRSVAGEWPANVTCDNLMAEIGETAGCTVTDLRGQQFGVIIEYIGGAAKWQWSMA